MCLALVSAIAQLGLLSLYDWCLLRLVHGSPVSTLSGVVIRAAVNIVLCFGIGALSFRYFEIAILRLKWHFEFR